jgi:S1-C subfamily serine protease
VAFAWARRRLTPIGTALAVALVALAATACGGHRSAAPSDGPATPRAGSAVRHGDGQRLDMGLVAVLARIGNQEVRSSGTVIDGDRGLVLTSAHSVWGASSLKLATGVAVLHGRIVARSPCDDLALVETQPWVPGMVALPQARGRIEPGPLNAVGRRWGDDGGDIVSTSAQAASGRPRGLPLLAAIAGGVRLDGALTPEASGGPVLDSAGRVVGIIDVASARGAQKAVAIPIRLVRDRMQDLRPGPGSLYVGWSEYYRCTPLQHAYAAAAYPGFRPRDARLNAPVAATRLPGTQGLDR